MAGAPVAWGDPSHQVPAQPLHKTPFLHGTDRREAAWAEGWERPAVAAIYAEEPCVGMPAFPSTRQLCFISPLHRKNNKHSWGLFSGCFVE